MSVCPLSTNLGTGRAGSSVSPQYMLTWCLHTSHPVVPRPLTHLHLQLAVSDAASSQAGLLILLLWERERERESVCRLKSLQLTSSRVNTNIVKQQPPSCPSYWQSQWAQTRQVIIWKWESVRHTESAERRWVQSSVVQSPVKYAVHLLLRIKWQCFPPQHCSWLRSLLIITFSIRYWRQNGIWIII